MTKKQIWKRRDLNIKIHTSKRYIQNYKDNQDEYVELLQEHFGASSSKDLDLTNLIIFNDYMNCKTLKLPYRKTKAKSTLCKGLVTKAQLKMIVGLWNDFARDKSDEALLEFVNKQTKKLYMHVHMISKPEAQQIIPILKKMKQK